MDWRGNFLLVVCVLYLLVNVACSLISFENGRMGVVGQRQSGSPLGGTTLCLLKCKIQPNPCSIGRRGCTTPINTLSQFRLDNQLHSGPLANSVFGQQMQSGSFSSSGLENQFIPQPSFPISPPLLTKTTTTTTTTTATTTTTTTILEKGVTEEQHNTFTTITSSSPQPTTKATGGITVNPSAFWMIFIKK